MTKKYDSWLLKKVGLTSSQVKEMCSDIGTQTSSNCLDKETPPPAARNYLSAEEQKRASKKLKLYGKFIFARYEEGYSPGFIAKILGVSGESVKSRLRKAGFFK